MFVFSSICAVALWFVVRLLYDALVPASTRARLGDRGRFWTVTLTAASIASVGAWLLFGALFSDFAAWYAALVVLPAYVGISLAMHALVGAFRE